MAAVLFWFTNASVDSVYRTVPHEIGRNINNIVEQDIYIEMYTLQIWRYLLISSTCLYE